MLGEFLKSRGDVRLIQPARVPRCFRHQMLLSRRRRTSELCADNDYIRMRSKRFEGAEFVERFKAMCESPLPVLPRLSRTYIKHGIAAPLASAPTVGALYPDGARDLNRLAEAMVQRQKFDDAIAVLELGSKIFPSDVRLLNTLANAYAAKGDVVAFWDSSRRALAINRNDPTARRALGLVR